MKPVLIILTFLTLISCSTPQMAFNNEDTLPNESFAVKGRQGIMINQKLSFGNFTTTNIKRSWTRNQSQRLGFVDVFWTNYEDKKQTIHFQLADGSGLHSDVFCVTRVHGQDIVIGNNPNSLANVIADLIGIGDYSENNYTVEIYAGRNNNGWQMVLDNDKAQIQSKSYVGYLARDKDNYYKIIPSINVEIKGKKSILPIGSLGYEFRNRADQLVAAVSLVNKGVVYFGAVNNEEKFLLANACAALLLQESID